MTDNYSIKLNKDIKTDEVITISDDGFYTIFINENLCELKRMRALRHALKHIESEDFYECDVQNIEDLAHKQ